ncbi:SpoIIE family protein phosphatase [Streptomyces sp. DT197]|uniref:SpoIIE family protein phosphatase n=1 Tax=Streptomyces sp. DT197 TaxID=3393417 RepID=UPI0037F624B4
MTGDEPDDATVLEALFGNSPQGLFVLDSELRVLRYNRAGRGVSGLSEEEVLGRRVEEFAPGLEPESVQKLAKEALDTGTPVRKRLIQGPSPSDPDQTLTLEMSFFPLVGTGQGRPAVVTVVEDMTAQQADADRLAVLRAVHASVGSRLDTPATAGELVQALVPGFADAAAVDLPGGRRRPTGEQPSAACRVRPPGGRSGAGRRGAGRRGAGRRGGSRPFPFPTPYTQALNDLRARLVPVSPGTEWLATSPEGFAPLIDAGVHSMIVAPLTTGEGPLGLLTLYRTGLKPFEDADLDIARQVAATAAAHLDNARRYRREHEAAAALHRRLQPNALPDLSAVEADYVYLPEGAGSGWFDVIPRSGTRVALVFGDVAGHGVEAAATMGQLRIALRTLTLQDLETDELLTHLDEVAAHVASSSGGDVGGPVATCAISVYDPVTRRCTMVRAGHPAPVVVEPDGTPLTVHVPEGPALGEGGGRVFPPPAVVELAPGSLLAHCTTGLFVRRDRGEGQDGGAPDTGLDHVLAATTRPLRELCDARRLPHGPGTRPRRRPAPRPYPCPAAGAPRRPDAARRRLGGRHRPPPRRTPARRLGPR